MTKYGVEKAKFYSFVRSYENAKNDKMQISFIGGFFDFVRCGKDGWSGR
jgi:hypothetical protein